ncbi:MAG TPA: toxin-antitoxin system, toxin component family protein [Streptomyces sp.]|nr:toxin-antitoxin system, toxin component family protein [Streptomyces sp.]
MVFAGGPRWASRAASALRCPRSPSAMRDLVSGLADAVRSAPRPPAGVADLCRALCEEMSARRGGRPVELRFERFPDEIEVTGLWMEFQDFDLVIVEERAEALQKVVILGHELWHLWSGHRHDHAAGTAAARALGGDRCWRDDALTVAARDASLDGFHDTSCDGSRDGSREADEAEADDFGHRLAAALRHCLPGESGGPAGSGAGARPGPVQRSLGYRGRRGGRVR